MVPLQLCIPACPNAINAQPKTGTEHDTTVPADLCTMRRMAAPLLQTTIDVHTRLRCAAVAVEERQNLLAQSSPKTTVGNSHGQLTPPTRSYYLAASTAAALTHQGR